MLYDCGGGGGCTGRSVGYNTRPDHMDFQHVSI